MLAVSAPPLPRGVKRGHSAVAAPAAASTPSRSQSLASGLCDEEPVAKRRKKVSSHSATTPQTQLAITQIRPTKFARAVPFRATRWRELSDVKVRRVLELFLPSYLFPSNSRSLVRMKDRDISSSRIIQYVIMIRLLCFLAFKVSSPSYVDASEDDEGGGGGGGRGKKKAQVRVDPQSEIVCTWEVVPHREDPKMAVGYRLRFTEKSVNPASLGMVYEFKNEVEANERMEWEKHMKGGPQVENRRFGTTATISETSLRHITHDRWMRMCMEYAPELREEVYSSGDMLGGTLHPLIKDLDNPDCPLFLARVFSIERSMEMARSLGADPRYCDINRYARSRGTHTEFAFADQETVWYVNHGDMRSYDIENLYMPHIRPEPLEFASQREAFVAHHAPRNASDEVKQRLAETFDLEVVQTTNNERPMDTYTLDAQVRSDLSEIEAQCGKDIRRAALSARARAKEVWIPMLTHVMDADNISAAPSLRAIGVATQEYLENNNHSFFQLRRRVASNLTRWQDYTASVMAAFNTVITVRTNHRDAYLYMLCALHVYIGSDLNPHVLALGPAGVGKSFLLKLLMLLLIKGTIRAVSDITPKALNVGGNDSDYLIYQLDDAKATMFGVGNNNLTNNSPSQDRVNTTKEMMTSREATVQTIEFDANGKRVGVVLKARTTVVIFANLNDDSSKFPPAVLDRAIIKKSANHDSNGQEGVDASVDIISKTTRSSNPLIKAASLHVQCHWSRKQMLMSRILILMGSGALPKVNLTMANIFFMLVKTRARKRGVEMDGTRKHLRWCSILSMIVVEDAVDLLWSSPMSPFAPKDGVRVYHDDSHFLEVAKHLRATTQHIVFALGFLADQWKNDLRRAILTAMLKVWFDKDELTSVQRRRAHPIAYEETTMAPKDYDGMAAAKPAAAAAADDAYNGMQERLDNWTHIESKASAYKGLASSSTTSKFTKVASQEDMAKHVANQLMEHLHPRPLFGEVEHIVLQMMQMTVVESRPVRHGMTVDLDSPLGSQVPDIRIESKKVSALIADPHCIRIAVGVLSNYNVDGMFESVQEVACMLHNSAEPRVYQYGEPLAHMPSVWQQMTATRKEFDGKEMRIMNADHFDAMESELTNAFMLSSGAEKLPETLFEKNEYYVPDVDIDEMVALKHGSTLGLSSVERLASPSNIEADTEKQWKQYWDRKQRKKAPLHYPESFVRFKKGNEEEVMKEKARKNPELYKMSTQMARLKQQEEEWSADAVVSNSQPQRAAQAHEDEAYDNEEEEEQDDDDAEMEREFRKQQAAMEDMDIDYASG